MLDKIASLLSQLLPTRDLIHTGLVPAINIRSYPEANLPPLTKKNLETCPQGMVIRWEHNGEPRAAIRGSLGWRVTDDRCLYTSEEFAELLVNKDIQVIRPAGDFMPPQEALVAICEANDLEVPSAVSDDEDEDEDEDDVLSELIRKILSDLVDDDDDDDDCGAFECDCDGSCFEMRDSDNDEDEVDGIEINPADDDPEKLQRFLRNLTPGTQVSWTGRSCGYRVRKMVSTYWAVVDPDIHTRLTGDEARNWYYFTCGTRAVVDLGEFADLGAGVINNGQLARILQYGDVHSVYLYPPK